MYLGVHFVHQRTAIVFPTLTSVSPTLSSISPTESVALNLYTGNSLANFSLNSLAGKVVSLSDFKGKPLVITLWATWCVPCQSEMPAFQAAYDQYQSQGLVILGINDTQNDSLTDVTAFVKQYSLTFPILLDDTGDVSAKVFNATGLPDSFFVDAQGVIRFAQIGELSTADLNRYIQALLSTTR